MPADRPTAAELVEAAAEHLAVHVRPALSGHAAFEALIAANLLVIARREMELGPAARAEDERALGALLGRAGSLEALEAELAGAIRSGRLEARRAEVLATLRDSARRRLEISNPQYL